MTCIAFEGAAGCGKTYRLLDGVRQALAQRPLREGQRLLAITYMHGARRKLDAALRCMAGLRGRYECSTLDSVAFRWTQRWRSLCESKGLSMPADEQFDETCELAARLVADRQVARWVASAFPVILIDEAQDLSPGRLAIVQALAQHVELFIAGDEFQCLQQGLRPNPFAQWVRDGLRTESLERVRRTDQVELLAAARALRTGGRPGSGMAFKIQVAPKAALAGAHAIGAVMWRAKGGTVALLAPSKANYVTEAVSWAMRNKTSLGHGPVRFVWEGTEEEEARALCLELVMPNTANIAEVEAAAGRLSNPGAAVYLQVWIARQRGLHGQSVLNRSAVEAMIHRAVANRRRYAKDSGHRLRAMTIQQAKNREFDGVIVLWPGRVGGSGEHKRRLLYNAITRARNWAVVVVQSANLLKAAPFC